MDGFRAVAGGLGRIGNEWSEARDKRIDDAISFLKSKLMLQEIQSRLAESAQRTKLAQGPQPYGMVTTPRGETVGVSYDPTKPPGQRYGHETIIPGTQSPLTPQAIDEWAKSIPDPVQRDVSTAKPACVSRNG